METENSDEETSLRIGRKEEVLQTNIIYEYLWKSSCFPQRSDANATNTSN